MLSLRILNDYHASNEYNEAYLPPTESCDNTWRKRASFKRKEIKIKSILYSSIIRISVITQKGVMFFFETEGGEVEEEEVKSMPMKQIFFFLFDIRGVSAARLRTSCTNFFPPSKF